MKGSDIECTTTECILPWVMRNWAAYKKFGVVGYTSSDIDLVCTTTGHTRPISQLLDTLAVIWILCTQPLGMPAMILILDLGCKTIGNTRVYFLGYRVIGYASTLHSF